MITAGIDIGSAFTKGVILENDSTHYKVIEFPGNAEVVARKVMEELLEDSGLTRDKIEYIVSTGASRKGVSFAHKKSSTTNCTAKAAYWLLPSARTVINVGAENSTVISLNEKGEIRSFADNDKCAAGAGAFLEAMSDLLELPLEEMIREALKAEKAVTITSTCAIFAEQEVISYAFDGLGLREIMAGFHEALALRVIGLAKKIQIRPEVFLCGGASKNEAQSLLFPVMNIWNCIG